MPILRKKEAAKAKAKELQEKYYVDYGDDASTYQLVDKETGKPAAVDIGGLGVDEGLFTKQRRLKKLVGREVQKGDAQKPVAATPSTPDKGGSGTKSKAYTELYDKYTKLESEVASLTERPTEPKETYKYIPTPTGPATKSLQNEQRQNNKADADAALAKLEKSEIPIPVEVPKGVKAGETFRFDGHSYRVSNDGTSAIPLPSLGGSIHNATMGVQMGILSFMDELGIFNSQIPISKTKLAPRQPAFDQLMPGMTTYPIGPSPVVATAKSREKGSLRDFYKPVDSVPATGQSMPGMNAYPIGPSPINPRDYSKNKGSLRDFYGSKEMPATYTKGG